MKKIKIFIILLSFILSFPIHFIYDLFPCFLTSIIAPVNESIWEHMKIIYTSILLSSIIEYFIFKSKQLYLKYTNIKYTWNYLLFDYLFNNRFIYTS